MSDWSDFPCDCSQSARSLFLPTNLDQSRRRTILIGPTADVNQEILRLHHCYYEIDGWSPPQPIPSSDEVVRVYIRRRRRVQ